MNWIGREKIMQDRERKKQRHLELKTAKKPRKRGNSPFRDSDQITNRKRIRKHHKDLTHLRRRRSQLTLVIRKLEVNKAKKRRIRILEEAERISKM